MTEVADIKLSVPWGHVAARTYGSSIGEPVLIVHGRLDNSGSFTRLMKYLPKELFYYVCIDLPGHGWSSHFPPWMILDLMDYAHTLYFIFEALQWKSCIYIGHSMGAQIGFVFSVFQPNRIKKLIALDGILMFATVKDFAPYFKTASALSIKAYHNEKPLFFTKEQILQGFKTMRVGALNSEAADAMFERAVTELNGKYMYNRDIRLKNHPFTFMNMDEFQQFNALLSIPIYLFIPSHGIIPPREEKHMKALEMMKAKTMLEIIHINGNHDVHNNNPEKVAPFICKILNNDHSSKL